MLHQTKAGTASSPKDKSASEADYTKED